MAIRFHCPFCDGLTGIADRKAGHVVTCPHCGGSVRVPGGPPPLPARRKDILTPRDMLTVVAVVLAAAGVAFALGLLVGIML